MESNITNVGEFFVVAIVGKITNHTSPDLKATIKYHTAENSKFLFDLTGVSSIDSTGLGCLVHCQRIIAGKNGVMRICCISDEVKIIFQVTGAYDIFEIYDSQEFALELGTKVAA